jgi:hypothetical protein
MLTLNKTKAALQSCQCHYEKPKQIKHTRVNAGGQSLNRAQRFAAPTNNARYSCDFALNSMPFIAWRAIYEKGPIRSSLHGKPKGHFHRLHSSGRK